MSTYVTSGGLALIGLLSGVVAALWWRGQYLKMKSRLALLLLKHEYEQLAHGQALADMVGTLELYEKDIEQSEALRLTYKDRLEALRARQVTTASVPDLINLANELRTFHEKGDEGEVAHEDSESVLPG